MGVEIFSVLDADTKRATLSAMTLLSLILILCCISRWVLYFLTAVFTLFAIYLAWQNFKPKSLKKEV